VQALKSRVRGINKLTPGNFFPVLKTDTTTRCAAAPDFTGDDINGGMKVEGLVICVVKLRPD